MGMKAGDLEDLVYSLLSIDEFESKIDNEKAIVVGFRVEDKEPAQDLSRFIEKSAVDLMDAEVSPAPDEDGKYIVFVEFTRDKDFPKKLVSILDSLENLTMIDQTQYHFTTYKKKGEHEADEDTIRRKVRLKPRPKKKDDIEPAIDHDEFGESIKNIYNKIQEAFEVYFQNDSLECANWKLVMEDRHLACTEQLVNLQFSLNSGSKQIREALQIIDETVIDFNKLRLEKTSHEIKKELADQWDLTKNSLSNVTAQIDNSVSELFSNISKILHLLSDAKNKLKTIPNSKNDITQLIAFEDSMKNDLVFYLKAGFIEYLSMKIRAKFATLLNNIGLYDEVFSPINEFFQDSAVDTISINDGKLILLKNNKEHCFEVINFMNVDNLFALYKLENIPFTLTEEAKWMSRDIYNVLGAGYAVNIIKGYVLLSKEDTQQALLLQNNS